MRSKFVYCVVCQLLSCVRLYVTLWTVTCQAPVSMGFSRQEYWSGQPLPSLGKLPMQGLNLGLPHCKQTLNHLSHKGNFDDMDERRTWMYMEERCKNRYCLRSFGLPWWLSGKESTCQCRRHKFDPWVGKVPWRRKWQPTPVFLPGKSHGRRSLVGYSPWGRKESDTTKQLHFHSVYSCHLFLISSASVSSIPFLSFIVPIFA